MNQKRIVYLAGVGGVGKTTIVNAIEQSMPHVKIVRSQSRKAYARTATTEKVALQQTEDERKAFQTNIWKEYLHEWGNVVNGDDEVVLFERSPYDYVAYQISVLPNLTVEEMATLSTTIKFMEENKAFNQTVLYVPFPVPWGNGDSESDATRFAPSGKNFVWDSLLRRLMLGTTWVHPLHEVKREDRIKRVKEWLDLEARSGMGELRWTHFCTQL